MPVSEQQENKKMLLFMETKRPISGKPAYMKVECCTDREGNLLLVTARRILKFINDELQKCESEEAGIDMERPAASEFKSYHSPWPHRKNDE